MYELSLNDNGVTFKRLEKEIYKITCEIACEVMTKVLTHLDRRLLDERNNKVYRNKGLKHNCIKTLMGNVEFDRRIYQYKTEDGKKAYKFLLDEYLKLNTIGHISTNLVEKIVDNVISLSYRKASQNIKESSNQDISYTEVWDVIQKLGSKIKEKEERKIELNKKGQLNGKKEVKMLFQEKDGIWLNMQGKDKPVKGKSKKKELKLGITYEGWKRREHSKNEYIVVNKTACASFEGSRKFKKLSDATIVETYNVDEIETRIINGDGASWIKQGIDEEDVYFQLDPFHKSQEVLRKISNKREAYKLIRLLNSEKALEGLDYVKNLLIEYNSNPEEFKKLTELYNYLVNNKQGLVPYYLRKNINIPKPKEGIEYRNLGTMEHNICDILAQRMKHRKMTWTINGANNLAKILAEKASGRIYSLISEFCDEVISKEKLNKITEMITLTAADVNKKPKKSNVYPIHNASIPFTGCAMNNTRKVIRHFVEGKYFSL